MALIQNYKPLVQRKYDIKQGGYMRAVTERDEGIKQKNRLVGRMPQDIDRYIQERELYTAISHSVERKSTHVRPGAKKDNIDPIENTNKAIALLEEGVNPNSLQDGKSLLLLASELGNYKIASLLIEKGASINFIDKYGRTPLHKAVASGNYEMAKLLVEKGSDTNFIGINGVTPLYMALEGGYKAIAELLLTQGADVLYSDREGNTLLHLAVQKCCFLKVINLLVKKGVDINAVNNKQRNAMDILINTTRGYNSTIEEVALFLLEQETNIDMVKGALYLSRSASLGMQSVVEYLIKRGVDINGIKDWPSLHAAIGCRQTGMVEFLLSRGAGVNMCNTMGDNALHSLSMHFGTTLNSPLMETTDKIFTILVNHGIDINHRNIDGVTPLCNAILRCNNDRLSELLIARGADVSGRDNEGNTLLHIAVKKRFSLNIIKLLITRGADINAVNEKQQNAMDMLSSLEDYRRDSAEEIALFLLREGIQLDMSKGVEYLSWAALYGMKKVVKCLFDKGVDISGKQKATFIHGVVSRGDTELLQLLLSRGVDINARNNQGDTVLPYVFKNAEEIMPLLVKYGVDINAVNNQGITPLEEAIMSDEWGLVTYLLKYKADITLLKNTEYKRQLLIVAAKNKYYSIVDSLLNLVSDKQEYFNICIRIAIDNNDMMLVKHLTKEGLDFSTTIDMKPYNLKLLLIEYALVRGKQEIAMHLMEHQPSFGHEEGGRAVYIAVAKGYHEIVKQLLEKGAKVNFQMMEREASDLQSIMVRTAFITEKTALALAVAAGDHLMTEILLSYKADVNLPLNRERKGGNLLHLASEKGCAAIVLSLIKHGVDVDIKDKRGNTALQYAATYGHIETIQVLLERGANIDVTCNIEWLLYPEPEVAYTPLQRAINGNHQASAKFLLEKGAKSDGKVLELAINKMFGKEFIELLIDKGADINYIDGIDGVSVLSLAAKKGNQEIFNALLDRGSNPYTEDLWGRNCMHYAVFSCNPQIVGKLIQEGLSLDYVDYNGNTPRHYALYFNKAEALNISLPAEFNIERYKKIRNILSQEKEFRHLAIDDEATVIALGEYSYKLSMLFHTVEEVYRYIENYMDCQAIRPIHDLCLFNLPSEGAWNSAAWAKLALEHGTEATNFLAFAAHIEKKLKRPPVSLDEVKQVAKDVRYARHKENPRLSDIFLAQDISENVFNKILDNHKPKSVDHLPDLFIDGKEFNEPKFYMKKLPFTDLRGYVLGKMTHCCQYVGQAGGGCAIHGMTSPYGGFYVVYKRANGVQGLERLLKHVQKCNTLAEVTNPQIMTEKSQRSKYIKLISEYEEEFKQLNSTGTTNEKFQYIKDALNSKLEAEIEGVIVAQSWAWISKEGSLVFDSWERLRTEDDKLCEPFMQRAAIQAMNQGIPRVILGASGLTPQTLTFVRMKDSEYPRDYSGYRDSEQQLLINSQAIRQLLDVGTKGDLSVNQDELSLILSKAMDLLTLKRSDKITNIDKEKIIKGFNQPPTYHNIKEYLNDIMMQEGLSYVSKRGGRGINAVFSDLRECFCTQLARQGLSKN